jgi:hypothetical protein
MKKVIFPLSILVLLSACTKQNLEDDIPFPDQVVNGNFEDIDLATNYWTTEGEGDISVSGDDAFDGSFAMKINPIGCYEVQYLEPLKVSAGATYELSFVTKIAGFTTGCLTEFYMVLEQGGENILEVNIAQGTAIDWDQRVLYVQIENPDDVYLKIYTGSELVLLDKVTFKRISSL